MLLEASESFDTSWDERDNPERFHSYWNGGFSSWTTSST